MTMSSRYDEMMKAKKFLPYHMGYLTPELVEQAEEELNEKEEVRKYAILELRKLIQEEAKLVCPTDDAYLLQYLRARKFDVKKAFTLLQSFYQVKKSYSELYDKCDVDALMKLNSSGAVFCLPYRDSDNSAIIIIRIAKWDPVQHPIQEALSALTCCICRCVEDPATQVAGVRILVDIRGSSLRLLRQLTPRYMHLISKALRNCFPLRFKGIHMYSQSAIFQNLWSIFQFFLSEKIRRRVQFHGDNQKQLHKFIPKEILPDEYGGDIIGFCESDWYAKEMEKFYERFCEIHTYGYKN